MKITHSLPAKVAAIFLIVVMTLTMALSTILIVCAAYLGCYTGDYEQNREDIASNILQYEADNLVDDFAYRGVVSGWYDSNNYYYVLTDDNGNVLASNYNGEEYLLSVDASRYVRETEPAETEFTVVPDEEAQEPPDMNEEGQNPLDRFEESETDATTAVTEVSEPDENYKIYSATLYAKKDFNETDNMSIALFWADAANENRFNSIYVLSASTVIWIILLVFLYCSAGRRRGKDDAQLNLIDRIPFDIFTVIMGVIACGLIAILAEIVFPSMPYFPSVIAIGIVGILMFLLFLSYTMSFATRVKVGGLIKRMIIYRILALIFGTLAKFFSAIGTVLLGLPTVGKTVLAIAIVSIIEIIAMASAGVNGEFVFFWFVEKVVLSTLILLFMISLRKLQKGGRDIANGQLNRPIDTHHMPHDCKEFAGTLNNIQSGIDRSVNARMKSERMKTELITNVSHDIKTPLTSIINYVDLIKKEEPESETMKEYLGILDRQSARLKKLIEDLVEASKASTGNLSVELAPCEVNILLEQTAGEYQEKIEQNGLELVTNMPEAPVRIMADGRRLWRIFDNLMNNVCKYSQPNTRVYIDLAVIGSRAVITFRNVSKSPLNISSDELMERFVRGDSSRNTEGSGLGLSIAKSLAELQHGNLSISIDGDLFKVMVSFDILKEA